MNIMILSAGTRNSIVRYFRRALGGSGRVIATDMSPLAPALYEADGYYIVPPVCEPGYMDRICDICRKEAVNAVLSLIDPELSLLALSRERLRALGVSVIGSSYELCEMALDKMKLFRWMKEHDVPCAESYDDMARFRRDLAAGKIAFPVFIKPIRGSASVSISKVTDTDMLEFLWRRHAGLMIQEYMNGQEIGADVYVDMISGEVVSIFTKKKLKMRAGETVSSVSFKDEKLFSLLKDLAEKAGYSGPLDIDLFEVNGGYYISDVNPRFGGGYPHAYECGVDHMKMIVENLSGRVNPVTVGQYEENIYMMKAYDVSVRKINKEASCMFGLTHEAAAATGAETTVTIR